MSALIAQEICKNTITDHVYKSFYAATHRIVFTCLIGYMIFSFHLLKPSNIIRWFLSHPLWQPLSKLSLSIYLVHYVYIMLSVSNTKQLIFYEFGWLVHVIAGDILMSTIYALMMYLILEAPIAKLIALYFK